MHVQFKEQNPIWFIPDWWFIENKLPIPPADSPGPQQEGGLGAAAVYLGNEIAIHGTDKPELLGQRVSHGCIRLSNENALRLYHNVQVGTPVVIVGPAVVAREQPDSVAAFTRPRRGAAPRRRNPLARVGTQTLLTRLDRELAAADTTHALGRHGAHADRARAGGRRRGAARGAAAGGAGAPGEMPQRGVRHLPGGRVLARVAARGRLAEPHRRRRRATARRDAIVEATMEMWHGALDERHGALAHAPAAQVAAGAGGAGGVDGDRGGGGGVPRPLPAAVASAARGAVMAEPPGATRCWGGRTCTSTPPCPTATCRWSELVEIARGARGADRRRGPRVARATWTRFVTDEAERATLPGRAGGRAGVPLRRVLLVRRLLARRCRTR